MVFEQQLSFNELSGILSDMQTTVTASEVHGSLCGLLCAPDQESGLCEWRDHVWGEHWGTEPEGGALMERLRTATEAALDSEDFTFTLLLPGEDAAAMGERTEALSEWCAGFLFGFAMGGGETAGLQADAAEFLDDLSSISRAEPPREPAGLEDERDFTEIVEYVKSGVLLLRHLRRSLTLNLQGTLH